ncbi:MULTISPECIES: PASTA domain-containing protein [unclassified Mycobacterium]|uniref:PASTA domain-containing protein n=1 Tax=unclassified Mycobacterium TaxID=2642494 RepID=UPI00336BD9C8
MKILPATCVAGVLLAGCSVPAPPESSSSTPAKSSNVQPKATAATPPLVVMPGLTGMQWTDVVPVCFDLGLVNFLPKEVAVGDLDKVGRVISQDPPAGAHVRPGSLVTLTFGTNAAPEHSGVEKR